MVDGAEGLAIQEVPLAYIVLAEGDQKAKEAEGAEESQNKLADQTKDRELLFRKLQIMSPKH